MDQEKEAMDQEPEPSTIQDPGFKMRAFFDELFGSYINILLLLFCVFLLFKILRKSLFETAEETRPRPPSLPPMKKSDLTIEQLKQFDGKAGGDNDENRILMVVNRNIFDVSRANHLYGSGGPYHLYAGRDASRGLATFSVQPENMRDTYDDLSDLTPSEWDSLREWESQLSEKYPVVGRLLTPGEKPSTYDDDVGEGENNEDEDKKKT